MTPIRLGAEKHPLGPQSDPGLVQAAEVYDAILTERPYPVKALVLFGTDPLLGHGDPLRGKAAFVRWVIIRHGTHHNPSAMFAVSCAGLDLMGTRALMPFFDIAETK